MLRQTELPAQTTPSSTMSNNPSFVLRGIEDVVFEERPIPESTLISDLPDLGMKLI